MPVSRQHIVDEIKRTAEANGGKPLGKQRFEKETGISEGQWRGVHWTKWSEALAEVGYQANDFGFSYDQQTLLVRLIELIRELGRFPVQAELRMKARTTESLPNDKSFGKLGSKLERVRKVLDYCRMRSGFDDVIAICEPLLEDEVDINEEESVGEVEFGFVYLMKSGKSYKIGYSNAPGRREYELAIQLPERLATVHVIKTDDPVGIEAYWHRRFQDKRKNGEWFELSAADVSAFRRRKFM